ncbi:MAG: TolC family outer membrane protein [Pseudomonadota bacterium]
MRSRHPRATAVLGLAALALALPPAAPQAESLADVMVEAWTNSPDLRNQRAQIRVASENAAIARAGGRPTVQGDIALGVERSNAPGFTVSGGEVVFPTTLALTATQPLYTGGQVFNQTEAAEKRITVQEAVLVSTEQQVLLEAITAFSDVRRDLFLLDVAENNVRVLTEQLRAAQERFEVGEVTRTDVEQARASLAASRSNLAATQGQLQISRETFADVVGRAPEDLDPPPPLPDLPETLEMAVQIAGENEPNLRAARIERDASGSDVRAAIGTLLPQVSLQGQLAQTNDVDDGFTSSRTGSLTLNITIPFYTGGANYAGVRQAQAGVEGAEAAITDAIRGAIRGVGVSWSQLEVARASIQAGRLEVRAAELAFEGVTEEAKVGARTTLDVLDAEEDVLRARSNLISSERDEYVAAYQLLSAMGMLTVDHLGLETGVEPPAESYYDSVRDRLLGYDDTDDTVWALPYRP